MPICYTEQIKKCCRNMGTEGKNLIYGTKINKEKLWEHRAKMDGNKEPLSPGRPPTLCEDCAISTFFSAYAIFVSV